MRFLAIIGRYFGWNPEQMIQHNISVFQLAVHFLPKIALRLERLFHAIDEACRATHPIIHHYALKNVIEIIKIIEKPELKSRFIKEMMRIEHVLNKSHDRISNAKYAKLFIQVQILSHLAGRFGESIHEDPFLQSIRTAQLGHSSDCELDAPQLLFWLDSQAEVRQENLLIWLKHLQILCDTVNVYLAILRDTATFEPITLLNGFYQRSLPARLTYQLMMIRMGFQHHVVPKIQLGQHGISIHLCDAYSMQEVRDNRQLEIELAICQL